MSINYQSKKNIMATGSGKESLFIQQLKQLILENIHNEQFGAGVLADKYGISRSQLHRKLKRATGKSITQFIKEIRLHRAYKMLLREEGTVSEIAYKVGFSSPTYFNTCFKDLYGYPPGEAKFHQNPEIPVSSQTSFFNLKSKSLYFTITIFVLLASVILYAFLSFDDKEIKNEPVAKKESIAVFPFSNNSGDPEMQYFSDAMSDAVSAKLSELHSLETVIPSGTLKIYKSSVRNYRSFARRLGVHYLLLGSFDLKGNDILMKVNLIDGKTGKIFWFKDYRDSWKIEKIFNMQSAIVKDIAARLNADSVELKTVRNIELPTYNEEAYNNYIKADFLYNQSTKASFAQAIPLYEKAIALDSTYTEAYIGLANVWRFSGLFSGMYPEQYSWRKAKELLKKAAAIDPNNIEVKKTLLGGEFYYEWDFEDVEKYFQEALINPSLQKDTYFLADYAMKTGRINDALELINSIIISNSDYPYLYTKKVDILIVMNRKEEARQFLQLSDSLFGNNAYHLIQSAKANFYLGDYKLSRKHLEEVRKTAQGDNAMMVWLDLMMTNKENTSKIKQDIRKLERFYANKTSGSPAWFLSLYYTAQNDLDNARTWLLRSFKDHEVEMTWLEAEPILEPLRNDPIYKTIIRKMKFPVEISQNAT